MLTPLTAAKWWFL